MHRIDTDTADPDANGSGKAGFRAGAPPGTAPTELDSAWFNAVQEEIANVVELLTGETLDKTNKAQLFAAIRRYQARQQLKAALSALRLAHDTGAGVPLRALARKSSNGQVIAVGDNGAIRAGARNTTFGSQSAGSPFTGDFYDIAYDATLGLYIAVGEGGEIQTSTGNGTWTRRAATGDYLFGVATNGAGLCVAVGAPDLIRYSTNGTSWSTATDPYTAASGFESVVFGAGVFVAANGEGSIISSSDGINWTTRRAFAGSGISHALAFDSTLGFLYHYDHDVFRSADGITWTKLHDSVSSSDVRSIVAAPYAWAVTFDAAGGTAIDGRYSVTVADQPADFTIDYAASESLTWMKFLSGQLWALGDDKVYVGGVL